MPAASPSRCRSRWASAWLDGVAVALGLAVAVAVGDSVAVVVEVVREDVLGLVDVDVLLGIVDVLVGVVDSGAVVGTTDVLCDGVGGTAVPGPPVRRATIVAIPATTPRTSAPTPTIGQASPKGSGTGPRSRCAPPVRGVARSSAGVAGDVGPPGYVPVPGRAWYPAAPYAAVASVGAP